MEVAALTHDLNYLVDRKSDAEAGAELRVQLLTELGFDQQTIQTVESIIIQGSTSSSMAVESPEAKALADAD